MMQDIGIFIAYYIAYNSTNGCPIMLNNDDVG